MRTSCVILALVSCAAAIGQTPAGSDLLDEVQKKYAAALLPKELRPPVTIEEADAFAAAINFFREGSKADLARIKAIEVPKDDRRMRQDRERLENWVGREVPRLLDETLLQTRNRLGAHISTGTDSVKFAAEIDLADTDKVRNNFANPDNVADRERLVRETTLLLTLMVRLDEQLGEKSSPWPEKKKVFDGYAATFREKLAASAAMVVPPKDIGDVELRKIAEGTLKEPSHGVSAWKRLIVNSQKAKKTYSVYEVRERSIVRVDYDYDHFQATTIETEGKDLFLFHNVLAYYRSGATTTPLNKWVVRERFRGARIVPENVEK